MRIENGLVYRENQGFLPGTVCIRDGVFVDEDAGGEKIDASGCYVIPGLVDIHFHGCAGYDFCQNAPERMDAIARYELENGITSICPTTCTVPVENLKEICKYIGNWAAGTLSADHDPHPGCARVPGLHLEGPFLSFEKKGAHNPYDLRPADRDVLLSLHEASGRMVKLLAIAPEIEGGMELIREITSSELFAGMHVSLAHTACSYTMAKEALKAGADHITHMFNAMPVFGHREPGVIGAALDTEGCYVELIGDGIHVSPTVIRASFSMFTDARIVLISDTIQATGMGDGACIQGGLYVEIEGKYARLKDGTIAGSVTNLMEGLRSVVSMGIPLESAVKCATINPARSIGIQKHIGSIETGKLGDCVILDQDLQIVRVIKGGI